MTTSTAPANNSIQSGTDDFPLDPPMSRDFAKQVMRNYTHNDLVQFKDIIESMIADGSSKDADRSIHERDVALGVD